MDTKKLFERYCPNCGEPCLTHDATLVSLGAGVQFNMQCENGHKWSEFYCLTYTGYWYQGKRYDSYGEEVIKKETEEKDG